MKKSIYITVACFLFTLSNAFAHCGSCEAGSKHDESPAAKVYSQIKAKAESKSDSGCAGKSCASACDSKKKANQGECNKGGACAYPLTTCVVSGDPLDTMGKPYVFTHGDWDVKLCCESCKEDFLADPDKYLAKLKDACKANKPCCAKDKPACKEGCTKPCCAKDKPACKEGCTKPCCAKDKPACKEGCTKKCCADKVSADKPGCTKSCGAPDESACKPGCAKPCCASDDADAPPGVSAESAAPAKA